MNDLSVLKLIQQLHLLQAEHMLLGLMEVQGEEIKNKIKQEIEQQLKFAETTANKIRKMERILVLMDRAMTEAMQQDPSEGTPERYCTLCGAHDPLSKRK